MRVCSLSRLAVPVVVCLGAALVAAGPASAAGIKGVVRYAGPPVPPKKLQVTIDQYICGKEKDAEDLVVSPGRGVKSAVVFLEDPPPDASSPAAATTVPMDQAECVFVPRVVIVPVGGTVEFLNSDRLLHNLHSVSRGNPSFNRTQPKGRKISVVFRRPEIVRIECDLHSWMRAWVVVAAHPFYALTNGDGEFLLGDVPPGTYTLRVWQERLGTVTRQVTVGPDGVDVVLEIGTR